LRRVIKSFRKKSPSLFRRGLNDDGDSWKPFGNGILTKDCPKKLQGFKKVVTGTRPITFQEERHSMQKNVRQKNNFVSFCRTFFC